MSGFDVSEVDRLLMTTRAVRRRLDLDRPVQREVVAECLRPAMYAPNASNTQLWRWLVVTDASKREQIGAVCQRLFAEHAPAASSADDNGPEHGADPEVARLMRSAVYLIENLHRVPVHVIPCYLARPDCEAGTAALSALYGSVLQAAWSFQLALRSRGLGSVWTTMHLRAEREVASILGIPETVTQVGLIPVAYTIGDEFKPAPRRAAEEVTYWNEWQTEA